MVSAKRVLVIDDDATVRQSVRRVLSEHGYEVAEAANGRQGLEMARTGDYDCALIDIRMPDVDGMEIVRSTRSDGLQTGLVIITGHATIDTAAEATRLGVADYIRKPFAPTDILRGVQTALDRQAAPPLTDRVVLDGLRRELRSLAPRADLYDDRTPAAVADAVTKSSGVAKARMPLRQVVLLGLLAGVYIGFGAALATLVALDAGQYVGLGLSKLLAGLMFCIGLILVVLAGAELFTGNSLMLASTLNREYGLRRLLGRWGIVYFANFAGAVALVLIMFGAGVWKMGDGAYGRTALGIAIGKVNLDFTEAFLRGVGCNWLVCLAVWMALAARDVAGKILAILFPITAFVALGLEHCVANMYFIPMGLLLKGSAVAAAVDPAALDSLTWARFAYVNLLPVTLGNIVGGALFVGALYWWVYMRPGKPT